MKTWIALLRGINVGGKNIIPMKILREVMESGGFSEVRSYIQSGNLVFGHSGPPAKPLENLIEKRFGFRSRVFILTPQALRDAADQNPYTGDAGNKVHFFFVGGEAPDPDLELLESLRADTEQFMLKGRILYLYAPEGIGRSKLVAKIDKAFPGMEVTARNRNTIEKLLELSGA